MSLIKEEKSEKDPIEEINFKTNSNDKNLLSKLVVFVEIYNDNFNKSSIFEDLLVKFGAILTKKLSKSINYIIFKDGKLKTIKYAIENQIPIVNPLWLHDKINKCFESDEKYLIKRTFTELNIQQNIERSKKKRRKFKRNTLSNNVKDNSEQILISPVPQYQKTSRQTVLCKQRSENISIINYFGINKEQKEKRKIEVYSFGLNEDQIEFLKGISRLDYKGEIQSEKEQKVVKVVFINNNFDKYDYKITSLFIKKKIIINIAMFITDCYLEGENQDISMKLLEKKSIKINGFNINSLDKLDYDFYINSTNMEKDEKGVIKKIIINLFHKKVLEDKTERLIQFEKSQSKGKKVFHLMKGNLYSEEDEKFGFDASINIKYIYDSFYNGGLIELNEKNMKIYSNDKYEIKNILLNK